MFNSKKSTLSSGNSGYTVSKTMNAGANGFLSAGLKESAKTLSGNLALKFSSTSNEFVDQFGALAEYKTPRTYEDISRSVSTLFAINAKLCIMFILFIRMITRVTALFDGTKTSTVQRGGGLKHEGIMRMAWLHINHPDLFWGNFHLLIASGSWKDIIYMMQADLIYHGWKDRALDWDKLGQAIIAGLENPNTCNLVKKYLPQIRANSACKTVEAEADNMIAKFLCSKLFKSDSSSDTKHYAEYRRLKVSGTAHRWQQLISRGRFLEINFDTVHGRALSQLVSGKFLSNNSLEAKYELWISSKPVAKFMGYPHELFRINPMQLKKYQVDTINKQFLGLVETAQKGAITGTSMIVVRDVSGSMSSDAPGCKMACGDVAKALALFFSYMLPDGAFSKSWIEFSRDAKLNVWKGSTPSEQWVNERNEGYCQNTDFQTVIDLFCKLKASGIPENEFPTGILCISDGEFDPAALNMTNVEVSRMKLIKYFSADYVGKFKIVLWNLHNRYYEKNQHIKFDTYGDVDNVYYFSGYDGSIVAFLTGVKGQVKEPKNAKELFEAAMDQELLNLVEV